MEERLKFFLAMEGLSPAQLADRLGVQRSGISHLLQGRNKPSFEFINKLLAEFPKINPDWLIMGTGKAYRDGVTAPIPAATRQTEPTAKTDIPADDLPMDGPADFDLFSANFADTPARPAVADSSQQQNNAPAPYDYAPAAQPQPAVRQAAQPQVMQQNAVQERIKAATSQSYPSENRIKPQNEATSPRFSGQKQIRQVVIFFTDGTYEIR